MNQTDLDLVDGGIADLDTAKPLNKIRLLVIGMSSLGAIVVRDSMKAGLKSVTMMDHEDWTEDDRPGQFLIAPESEVPENRAVASTVRAQILNHRVEVYVKTENVSEVHESFYSGRWDVVVAAGLRTEDILKVNRICRNLKIKFFASNIFGMFGYFFSDLLDEHVFRKPVRGINSPYGGKPEDMVIRSERFVPFDAIFSHKFDTVYDFVYSSPWYFTMRGLLRFVQKYGRHPTREFVEHETVKFLINNEVESAYRRDDNKVPISYVQLSLGPPVPVICQLVGSMLVKEIVKAGTHLEEPYNNVYLFDPVSRTGSTAKITGL